MQNINLNICIYYNKLFDYVVVCVIQEQYVSIQLIYFHFPRRRRRIVVKYRNLFAGFSLKNKRFRNTLYDLKR